MKPRIRISFSGGRTSGFMAKHIKDRYAETHDLLFLFANTGQEHEETLAFVDRCDRTFGLELVWVEAVVHPEHGVGTTHRVVDYLTASRHGEPFEEVIKKYGIPNPNYQPCNRELKTRSMDSYARSIGWARGTYDTAIGIRADEADRMAPDHESARLWYPLVEWGVRKPAVRAWWRDQPFDLGIPEHLGNCVWCWKKSLRKHLTLISQYPAIYDFPRRMEQLYPNAGAGKGGRVFFRERRSVEDLFELAKKPFRPFVEDGQQSLYLGFGFDAEPATDEPADMDLNGSCGETCEPGADRGDEEETAPDLLNTDADQIVIPISDTHELVITRLPPAADRRDA